MHMSSALNYMPPMELRRSHLVRPHDLRLFTVLRSPCRHYVEWIFTRLHESRKPQYFDTYIQFLPLILLSSSTLPSILYILMDQYCLAAVSSTQPRHCETMERPFFVKVGLRQRSSQLRGLGLPRPWARILKSHVRPGCLSLRHKRAKACFQVV